jgi:hypothetical protein
MASKLSDKDEVALLMQQQGLSRVQATKLIYEMAKQKKKEEANASAGSKGPSSAQPTVPVSNRDPSWGYRSAGTDLISHP